jgi:hypothetical protein
MVLPKQFVEYVAAFKKIPLPPDTHLDTLRSQIELICLELSVGVGEQLPSPSGTSTDE